MGSRRLPRNLVAGVVLLLALGLSALLAPWLGGDPNRAELTQVLEPPSAEHWLGTDPLGRDLGARLLHGGRVSLGVGLLTALLALALGLPLGALAGYGRPWLDALVSRLIEAVLCFPGLVLALALLAMSPPWLQSLPGVLRVALVLSLSGWVPVARYLRGEFMRIRGSDMVAAARSAGAGDLRIVVRHILPSSMAPVLVTTSFAVGGAVLVEAALSFIGVGISAPTPTWGNLLKDAWENIDRAWWLALFPGVLLFLTVLGCNLVGEGVRDRLDPRSGGR